MLGCPTLFRALCEKGGCRHYRRILEMRVELEGGLKSQAGSDRGIPPFNSEGWGTRLS